jgi:hypothetical protein
MEMYAVLTSSNASHFTQDLASVAKRHDLTPSLGRATDDRGHTLYVVEAKGRWMRLWSQNMPLSGQEDPVACGKATEAHPDPGQYIITVEPTLPFLNSTASVEVAAQLRQELAQLGYEIREKPVACSSLARSAMEHS